MTVTAYTCDMASMTPQQACDLPYLTADIPGIGGSIKCRPADFVVEEIPAYEAAGEGTHIYFTIEKEGVTTPDAIRRIARELGKQTRDIGYAGMKDATAVTRQMLSVEHVDPELVRSLSVHQVRVLNVDRHRNKIKLGHLRGNRFILKIREAVDGALSQTESVLDVLSRRGLPNYFGPQRFGARGDNWCLGRAVLRGEMDQAMSIFLGGPADDDGDDVRAARAFFDEGRLEDAARAWPGNFREQRRACNAMARSGGNASRGWSAIDKGLRRLFISAFQSHLFNKVVAERIGALDKIESGDIAYKHANGACFGVEDAEQEQSRCASFEISPTGPLVGHKMMLPTGRTAEVEASILGESGVEASAFGELRGMKLAGERRPLRIVIDSPEVSNGTDEFGRYVRLVFALPPGSYATSVTREIVKGL
jgi:tRNA pseudouridine13 synthase